MEPEVTEMVAGEVAIYMDNPVTSYSGGWRMKTQLTTAKLPNADVLMLNEPTGHSDVNDMRARGCARTSSTSRTAKWIPSRAQRPVA